MSKNIKKQKGGKDIVAATESVILSMVKLGKDIFNEIDTITHFKDDLNRGVPSQGIPNNSTPSPTFDAPPL